MPPPTGEGHLLLVVLDDLGGSRRGVVGVESGVAAGTALTQQVPALVQEHLDLGEPFAVGVGRLALGLGGAEAVLLVGELVDRSQRRFVSHRPNRTPQSRSYAVGCRGS